MSLPSTGHYRALVHGHELHFDGLDWSSDMPLFALYLPLLRSKTLQQMSTHLTIEVVARAVLRYTFPSFQELDFGSDTWTTPLS